MQLQVHYLLYMYNCRSGNLKIDEATINSLTKYRLSLSEANKYCRGEQGKHIFCNFLGSGAYGTVYKAEKTDIGRNAYVAIKLLAVKSSNPDKLVKEASLLFHLTHQHIVRFYESYQYTVPNYGNGLAIVTQYCSNGDLQSYLSNGNHPNIALRFNWYHQLADACSYLHDQQIVHRDIKPANILVDGHDNLYLCDVGLAKAAWEVATSGDTTDRDFNEYMTSAAGARYYMAPEVWSRHYTNKCDVFSLGVVFIKIAESRAITDNPTADQGQPLGKVLSASVQKPCDVVNCQFNNAERAEIVLCNKMLQYDPKTRLGMGQVKQETANMQTQLLTLVSLTEQYNNSVDDLVEIFDEEGIYVKSIKAFCQKVATASSESREILNSIYDTNNESVRIKNIHVRILDSIYDRNNKSVQNIHGNLRTAFTKADTLTHDLAVHTTVDTVDFTAIRNMFDESMPKKSLLKLTKDFNKAGKSCEDAAWHCKAWSIAYISLWVMVTIFFLFLLLLNNQVDKIKTTFFDVGAVAVIVTVEATILAMTFGVVATMITITGYEGVAINIIALITVLLVAGIVVVTLLLIYVAAGVLTHTVAMTMMMIMFLPAAIFIKLDMVELSIEALAIFIGCCSFINVHYNYKEKVKKLEKIIDIVDSITKSIETIQHIISAKTIKVETTKQCVQKLEFFCEEHMYPCYIARVINMSLDKLYKKSNIMLLGKYNVAYTLKQSWEKERSPGGHSFDNILLPQVKFGIYLFSCIGFMVSIQEMLGRLYGHILLTHGASLIFVLIILFEIILTIKFSC